MSLTMLTQWCTIQRTFYTITKYRKLPKVEGTALCFGWWHCHVLMPPEQRFSFTQTQERHYTGLAVPSPMPCVNMGHCEKFYLGGLNSSYRILYFRQIILVIFWQSIV